MRYIATCFTLHQVFAFAPGPAQQYFLTKIYRYIFRPIIHMYESLQIIFLQNLVQLQHYCARPSSN